MLPILHYCGSCGAANPREEQICFACQQPLYDTEDEALYIRPLHGQYQILEQVGTGGFGAVYRAQDLAKPERTVAIKQIRLRGLTPQQIIDATDTFNREVDLLTGLSHPHLPLIYDHFNDPEHWYLVMEFIEGETLEAHLQRQGQSSEQRAFTFDGVLDVGLQLCDVLSYLHTRRPPIIFRDLKPGNIMRTPRGHLYLIDFGIARRFTPGKLKDTMPLGSPGYAAPEQYGKAQTTERADIYSLGALLHQLLTGHDPADNPFQFKTVHAFTYAGAGITELEALTLRMVERDASLRPESVREVQQTLENIALQYTTLRSPVRARIHGANAPSYSYTSPTTFPGWTSSTYGAQQQQQVSSSAGPASSSRRKVLAGLGIGAVAVLFGAQLLAHTASDNTGPYSPYGDGDYRGDQFDNSNNNDSQNNGQGNYQTASGNVTTFLQHTEAVLAAHWLSDGHITSIDLNTMLTWDVATGTIQQTNRWGDSLPNYALWSPDGKYIAFISGNVVEVRDMTTAQLPLIVTYSGHRDVVNQIAWSPDSTHLASGSADKTVQIWDAATGKSISTYTAHNYEVYAVAWSPDGTRIVSSDTEAIINLWEVANGKTDQSYPESMAYIGSATENLPRANASWSPDGKYIAAINSEYTTIWDTSTNALFAVIEELLGAYKVLAWSPDSRYVAYGKMDASIDVWDITTQTSIFSYTGHSYSYGANITSIEWSPDGSQIASTSEDKSVQVWKIVP